MEFLSDLPAQTVALVAIFLIVLLLVKVACVYVLCVLVHRRRLHNDTAEVGGMACLTFNETVIFFLGPDGTHVRACKERGDVPNEEGRDNLVINDVLHNIKTSIRTTFCSSACTNDSYAWLY